MIPLLHPSAPERDVAAKPQQKARDRAGGGSFDGEIEGLARRGKETVRADDTAGEAAGSPEGGVEATKAGSAETTAERSAGGEPTLVDVLAALVAGERREAVARAWEAGSGTPAGESAIATAGDESSVPSDFEVGKTLARLSDARTGGEPADEARPRVRLSVARQETHFEPSPRDAILVDARQPGDALSVDAAAGPGAGAEPSKGAPDGREPVRERFAATPAKGERFPKGQADRASGPVHPIETSATARDAAEAAPSARAEKAGASPRADGATLLSLLNERTSVQDDNRRTAAPGAVLDTGRTGSVASAERTLRGARASERIEPAIEADAQEAIGEASPRRPDAPAASPSRAGTLSREPEALRERTPVSSFERAAPRDGEGGRSAVPVAGSGGTSSEEPVPATSVSSQIAGRIVDAFADASGARRPDAPFAETHLRFRAGGAVLKTLVIELQPEHLGSVSVSLRLKDGELAVEMAASRAETTRLLLEDRAALKSILERAGFSLDDTAITVSTREAPTTGSTSSTGREGADGAREPGRNGGEAGGGDRGGRNDRSSERDRPEPQPRLELRRGAARGGVFL